MSIRELKAALRAEKAARAKKIKNYGAMTKDIPPVPTVPLKSVKVIDYTNLQSLLAAGKWEEADEETGKKMCEVTGRQEELELYYKEFGIPCEDDLYLYVEDIINFPCEDLRTIDQLWLKSSNGHFGFSVQKRIYQSMGVIRGNEKTWQAFAERVGWRTEKKSGLAGYTMLNHTFSITAPEGHLPVLVWLDYVGLGEWYRGLDSLVMRLAECNI
jgi:serine/threonine-protein kinase